METLGTKGMTKMPAGIWMRQANPLRESGQKLELVHVHQPHVGKLQMRNDRQRDERQLQEGFV